MQYFFGTGAIYATSNKAGTNTPRKFGALQELMVDFAYNIKELYGQNQYPLAIGRGFAKVTGKAKAANFNAAMLADLFFNPTVAPSTTQTSLVEDEKRTVASTTTIANNTTGFKDLGVIDNTTGLPMTKVASAPAIGQYSVNEATATYTWNASFPTEVLLGYTFTATVVGSSSFSIDNQKLGIAPFFAVQVGGEYQQPGAGGTTTAKQWSLKLNQCMAQKWSLQTKQEDFVVPEFDFVAFADASGIIGLLSFEE